MRHPIAPAVILCALVAGCGGGGSHASGARPAPSAEPSTVSAPRTRPHRTHEPLDPGALPQTRRLPTSDSALFHTQMRALWRAIRTGNARLGRAAFFPERAYAQVKAIADPAADFRDRLLAEYGLDIEAAHALLGAGAAKAHLVRVDVPQQYAHWVDPGACYNRVGYYEVPNSRVVYREGGALRSFGIASMISWRGVWYVVHLGAVTRSGAGGVVDDPGIGPGMPAPSSTC